MPKYFSINKDLLNEFDRMTNIDKDNIESELENNIGNEAILIQLLYDVNDTLIQHETALASKKKEVRLKYMLGKTDDEDELYGLRINKTELETIVDSNRDVIVLKQKIKEINNIVEYYEKMLQTVRNKNYTLKNIIDFRKFQAGE